MEPSSPPQHTWAGASFSMVPRGVHGALPAQPVALGKAPSQAGGSWQFSPPHRQDWGQHHRSPYCTAMHLGTSTPAAMLKHTQDLQFGPLKH